MRRTLASVENLSPFSPSAFSFEAIPGVKTVYEILTPGESAGPAITVGDKVTVHATGVVKDTGKSSLKIKKFIPVNYYHKVAYLIFVVACCTT